MAEAEGVETIEEAGVQEGAEGVKARAPHKSPNTQLKTLDTKHQGTQTYLHLAFVKGTGNLERPVLYVSNPGHVNGRTSYNHKTKIDGLTSSAKKKVTSSSMGYYTTIQMQQLH